MSLGFERLSGLGYIILNVLRPLNILSLCYIVVASVILIAKTIVISRFFFFDAFSHVARIFFTLFLTLSEIPFFYPYYEKFWPLLAIDYGFELFSLCMFSLGLDLLGCLNRTSMNHDSFALALPFWRAVLSAGILALILSSLNLICTFIFRDTSSRLTARQIRSYGAMARAKANSRSMKISLPVYNQNGTISTKHNRFNSILHSAKPSTVSSSSSQLKRFRSAYANEKILPASSTQYQLSAKSKRCSNSLSSDTSLHSQNSSVSDCSRYSQTSSPRLPGPAVINASESPRHHWNLPNNITTWI